MKRIWSVLCALLLAGCLSAFAQQDMSGQSNDKDRANSQDQSQMNSQDMNHEKGESKSVEKAEAKENKAAEKGKTMRLTGWVKTEGDKVQFVNDKDKETWDVSNADILKAHDGHHVKVKAKLNAADHSMTVQDVKMMRKSKQTKQEEQQENQK